jgi:hypothetical protein
VPRVVRLLSFVLGFSYKGPGSRTWKSAVRRLAGGPWRRPVGIKPGRSYPRAPEFLSALRDGINGRIVVTYFEWAGPLDQKIIVPWRLIDRPDMASAVATEIASAPYRRAPRTSIFGALEFAKPLFNTSGYRGLRRIIDVSGDGTNNIPPSVTLMRDEVVAAGITINGLPIMLNRPFGSGTDIANLVIYYEDCVIGGPGAFVIAVHERDQFKEGDAHQAGVGDRRSEASAARHSGTS